MFDNVITVFKFVSDLHFYVTGTQDENELILVTVLQALFDAISLLLRCAHYPSMHHPIHPINSAPTRTRPETCLALPSPSLARSHARTPPGVRQRGGCGGLAGVRHGPPHPHRAAYRGGAREVASERATTPLVTTSCGATTKTLMAANEGRGMSDLQQLGGEEDGFGELGPRTSVPG